jgi:hypothetical protein
VTTMQIVSDNHRISMKQQFARLSALALSTQLSQGYLLRAKHAGALSEVKSDVSLAIVSSIQNLWSSGTICMVIITTSSHDTHRMLVDTMTIQIVAHTHMISMEQTIERSLAHSTTHSRLVR